MTIAPVTLPDVELTPGPVAGDSRCQVEWMIGAGWDRDRAVRCERPAVVDAIVVCQACGEYVRSWCGPCAADMTAVGPDKVVCAACDRPGAVVVATHPRT